MTCVVDDALEFLINLFQMRPFLLGGRLKFCGVILTSNINHQTCDGELSLHAWLHETPSVSLLLNYRVGIHERNYFYSFFLKKIQ